MPSFYQWGITKFCVLPLSVAEPRPYLLTQEFFQASRKKRGLRMMQFEWDKRQASEQFKYPKTKRHYIITNVAILLQFLKLLLFFSRPNSSVIFLIFNFSKRTSLSTTKLLNWTQLIKDVMHIKTFLDNYFNYIPENIDIWSKTLCSAVAKNLYVLKLVL